MGMYCTAWCVCVCVCVSQLSHVQLFCNPKDCVAHQASLSVRFPMQKYWSRLPFPCPRDLLHPEIKAESPALQVYSLLLSHQEIPGPVHFVFFFFSIYLLAMPLVGS